MQAWQTIQRCDEVTWAHLQSALLSEEEVVARLDHLAKIARPEQGAAVLLAFASATAACSWFRGALVLRIDSQNDASSLSLFSEQTHGWKRTIWSALVAVPFAELATAVVRHRRHLLPIKLIRQRADRIVLGAPETRRNRPLTAEALAAFTDSLTPVSIANSTITPSDTHRTNDTSDKTSTSVALTPPSPTDPEGVDDQW